MKKLTVYILAIIVLTCGCGAGVNSGVNRGVNNTPINSETNSNEETYSQENQPDTNQEMSLNEEAQNENTEVTVEKLHPIDIAERDCISKNMTTAGMNNCSYEAMDAWFKEIDKYIDLLKTITSEEDYNNILKAQQKWKEYQEAEFKAVSILINKQGTIYQNFLAGRECDLVKQRAHNLKSFYEDLIEE